MSKEIKNIKGSGGDEQQEQYIPMEIPDSLHSKTIIKVIDAYSEGEIEGIVDVNGNTSETDGIYFDGAPYSTNDVLNFSGVKTYNRYGTPSQSHIPGFPSSTSYTNVSAEITKANPLIRTITDTDTDDIKITLSVPSLLLYTNKGDLLTTSVHLKIEGKSSGAGEYSSLMSNVIITGKTSSKYQRTYTIYNIGNLLGAAPWEIKISRVTDDQDDTNQQYEDEAEVAGTGTSKIANKTYWDGYTKITNEKMQYPNTAYTAFEFDSSEHGKSIPVRSFLLKGRKVKVPTMGVEGDWDETANDRMLNSFYDGIWTGNFNSETWTDNPAWIYYDLLINDRYGMGIPEEKIDKYALFTISKYCDELVSDGFGGLEPRFTINCVIDKQETAYNVINMLASAFNAMPFFSSGKCTIVQDSPKDSDYIVSPANIIGDFNYSGTGLKTRFTVINVTWNNPALLYDQDIETVEDPEGIQRYGYNVKSVVAYGCTSQGQAHRYGKWILYTELNQTTTIGYIAGLDHIMAMPGEIIKVNDPHLAAAQFGGRMKSISGTSVTLDREVQLSENETYTISIAMPAANRDGQGKINEMIETKSILNSAGNHKIITIDTEFTSEPIVNAMWIISGTDVAPREFRIVSVSPKKDHTFEVSAVSYDANKFLSIEDLPLLEKTPYTRIETDRLSAPENVKAEEFAASNGTNVAPGALISWNIVEDPRVMYYEIQMKREDTGYVPAGESTSNSYERLNLREGAYDFRVRSVGPFGSSPWSNAEQIIIAGIGVVPTAVSDFTATATLSGADLTWTSSIDPFISGYEVRHGDNWATAEIVENNFKGGHIFYPLIDNLPHTFLIRAISYWGVYGDIAFDTVTLAPPELTSSFVAKKQDDSIYFKWDPVQGEGLEYEIRAGQNWESGEFVLKTSGDSATKLFPSEESVKFWIKTLSSGGVYSLESRFYTVLINLIPNRNLIIEQNERPLWTGRIINMTQTVNDDLSVDILPATGNFWGSYSFLIDLGQSFKARNWLDARMADETANITWADADFAWNSEEANKGWVNQGNLDNIRLKKYIYKKPSIDDFKPVYFGASLNDTFAIISQSTNDEDLPTSYSVSDQLFTDARILKGLYMTSSSTLQYAKDMSLPDSFSFGFKTYMNGSIATSKSASISIADGTKLEIVILNNNTVRVISSLSGAAATNTDIDISLIANSPYYNICALVSDTELDFYIYSEQFDKVITQKGITLDGVPKTNSGIQIFEGSDLTANSLIFDVFVDSYISDEDELLSKIKSEAPLEYNDAEELYVGDYEYEEAIADVVISAPAFANSSAMYKCKMFVDVPDIVEAGSSTMIASQWTEITFVKEYNTVAQFSATLESGTGTGIVKWQAPTFSFSIINGRNVKIYKVNVRIADPADPDTVSSSLSGTVAWTTMGY